MPPINTIKLNVDGTMVHDQQCAGIGATLRNIQLEVLMAVSKKENMVQEHLDIELVALLRGLQLCLHMSLRDFIVEIDSVLMVKVINVEGASKSLLGNIIRDIQSR